MIPWRYGIGYVVLLIALLEGVVILLVDCRLHILFSPGPKNVSCSLQGPVAYNKYLADKDSLWSI